jgi:hypothetical protein
MRVKAIPPLPILKDDFMRKNSAVKVRPNSPKKPVVSTAGPAEGAELCRCSHAAAAHIAGGCTRCDCRSFRLRPCVCGHSRAEHVPGCAACSCKQFRIDKTPDFLLRMGVHAGEWQFVTVPQLEFLMRPGHAETVRIWACGMKHSIGQRSRMAVKAKDGEKVPLSPSDIVDELNALDTIGRMTRQNVRRALAELERAGAVRRAGRQRNNVRLFFYARPLTSRQVPDEEENLVVKSDYQSPVSDSLGSHLLEQQISRIQGVVVKTVLRGLREVCKAENLVVKSDYKNIIQEALKPALEVVSDAYQRLLFVVKSGGAYKEDSISSSIRESPAGKQATVGSTTPTEMPACMPRDTHREEPQKNLPLADLRSLFPSDYISDDALIALDARIAVELGEDYDRLAYVAYVERQMRHRKIGTGLVFGETGLTTDYCKKTAAENRERAASAAEAERRAAAESRQFKLEQEYEEYKESAAERAIAALPGREWEKRVAAAMKDGERQYPQYWSRLPQQTRKEAALRSATRKLLDEIELISFEEFCRTARTAEVKQS